MPPKTSTPPTIIQAIVPLLKPVAAPAPAAAPAAPAAPSVSFAGPDVPGAWAYDVEGIEQRLKINRKQIQSETNPFIIFIVEPPAIKSKTILFHLYSRFRSLSSNIFTGVSQAFLLHNI
jgi:hypothetical protein